MRFGRHRSVIFETHATSLDNEAGLASGWFDVDLSALGEEQARTLGERRRADDLASVYCSDLRRAWRTAELAFGSRTIPVVRDDDSREILRIFVSEVAPHAKSYGCAVIGR